MKEVWQKFRKLVEDNSKEKINKNTFTQSQLSMKMIESTKICLV